MESSAGQRRARNSYTKERPPGSIAVGFAAAGVALVSFVVGPCTDVFSGERRALQQIEYEQLGNYDATIKKEYTDLVRTVMKGCYGEFSVAYDIELTWDEGHKGVEDSTIVTVCVGARDDDVKMLPIQDN